MITKEIDNGVLGGMNVESGDESDHQVQQKSMDQSVPWELEVDDRGWPKMPVENNFQRRQGIDVMRSFLTMTYSESCFV
jgi:hypothetical protein